MLELLTAGAVPDTWAPSGSSALMLAACADGVGALRVLLEGGASVELQDALGRWDGGLCECACASPYVCWHMWVFVCV
jgi:hypothetical protein